MLLITVCARSFFSRIGSCRLYAATPSSFNRCRSNRRPKSCPSSGGDHIHSFTWSIISSGFSGIRRVVIRILIGCERCLGESGPHVFDFGTDFQKKTNLMAFEVLFVYDITSKLWLVIGHRFFFDLIAEDSAAGFERLLSHSGIGDGSVHGLASSNLAGFPSR